MWFKNLFLYQIEQTALTTALFSEKLSQFPSVNLRPIDRHHAGFVAPSNLLDGPLLHEIGAHRLLRVRYAEKLLPAQVVNYAMMMHQQEKGESLKGAAKRALKAQITDQLLLQAFTRFTDIDLWWDTEQHLIGINSASTKRCELALDLLRKALGHLQVKPFSVKNSVSLRLTQWLKNPEKQPKNLTLGTRVELRGNENSRLNSRDIALDSAVIESALAEDHFVHRLAIETNEGLSAYLCEDLGCRQLQFSEALQQEIDDTKGIEENPIALIDTELALMGPILRQFTLNLERWLA